MVSKADISSSLLLPVSTEPSWSPDDSLLAYRSTHDEGSQLYTYNLLTKEHVRLSHGRKVSTCTFSPTKNEILYGKKRAGSDAVTMYIANIATGRSFSLFKSEHELRRAKWSPDGKWIAASLLVHGATNVQPVIIPRTGGTLTELPSPSGWCEPVCFSPSGNILLLRERVTTRHARWWFLHRDTNELKPFPMEESEEETELLSPMWADERHLLFLSNFEREFLSIYEFNLKTEAITLRLGLEMDIELAQLHEPTRQILVLTNESGFRLASVCDATTFEKQKGCPKTDGLIFHPEWSHDGTRLAFAHRSPQAPSTLHLWDLRTNEVSSVLDDNQRLVDSHGHRLPLRINAPSPTHVSIPTFDGRSLHGLLYKPDGAPKAAVVYVHGGPSSQIRPAYYPLLEALRRDGFLVLAPNIRGSRGFGKTFMALDDQEKRHDCFKDMEAVHRYLTGTLAMDPQRIGIAGTSYGGYMTIASLAYQPELWKAGVAMAGFADLQHFLERTSPHRRALREKEYGSLSNPELLQSLSPIHHADRIRSPLLLLHGGLDPRVPVSDVEQLEEKIRSHGGHVDLHIYPKDGHGLSRRSSRADIAFEMIRFFEEHLVRSKKIPTRSSPNPLTKA
ncbi:S9 family peptidase [Candidatus Uhrbacteria bacterium]|nr:S9 family peptidase [Candidatus Uhrbacteria bacterium]